MTEAAGSETTFGEKLQARWGKLTDGDVRDIGKDMDVLANKVSSIYERSKEDTQKEIAEFQMSLPK